MKILLLATLLSACVTEPLPGFGEKFACSSQLRCLPDGELFTIEPVVCAQSYEDAYYQLYDIVEATGAECPNGYDTQTVECEPAGNGYRRPCQ